MLKAKKAKKITKSVIKISDEVLNAVLGIFEKALKGESQYSFEYKYDTYIEDNNSDDNDDNSINKIVNELRGLGYDVYYSSKSNSNFLMEPSDCCYSTTVTYTIIVVW